MSPSSSSLLMLGLVSSVWLFSGSDSFGWVCVSSFGERSTFSLAWGSGSCTGSGSELDSAAFAPVTLLI